MAQVMQSSLLTLAALEAVAEHQPIGVAELARLLGRPKSTAQRALVTLHEGGWVRPDGSDRTRWVLTGRVLSVARQVANQRGLRDLAHVHLEHLRAATGESTTLSVLEGYEVVTVDFLEGTQSVRFVAPVGARVPIYVGATGKVVLAFLGEADQRAVLEGELTAMTPRTLTSADALSTELARIRANGYAVSRAEVTDHVCGVAAPILTAAGTAFASIGVTAPVSRFTEAEELDVVTRLVVDAAGTLTAELSRSDDVVGLAAGAVRSR